MINKQKLWFLTLFSLILVLSVYYITMPSDLLSGSDNDESSIVVNMKEEDSLSALRVLSAEERLKEMEDLRMILTNIDSTLDEKNNAYEKLQLIEETKGKESKLESKIKEEYNLESFIKIKNNQIKVVVKSDKHSYELANNIIRSIQEEYDENIEKDKANRSMQPKFTNDKGESLLMQCRHCIRYSLGFCVKRGGKKPSWREPLFLQLGDGRRFRLEFACNECQMNLYSEK